MMEIKEEPIDLELHFEPLNYKESMEQQPTSNLDIKLEDDPLKLNTVMESSNSFKELYDILKLQKCSSEATLQIKNEPPDPHLDLNVNDFKKGDNFSNVDSSNISIKSEMNMTEEWPELDIQVLNYPHISQEDKLKEEVLDEDSSSQSENKHKKQKLTAVDPPVMHVPKATPLPSVIYLKKIKMNLKNTEQSNGRLETSNSQIMSALPYIVKADPQQSIQKQKVSYNFENENDVGKNIGVTSSSDSSSSKSEIKLHNCGNCGFHSTHFNLLIDHLSVCHKQQISYSFENQRVFNEKDNEKNIAINSLGDSSVHSSSSSSKNELKWHDCSNCSFQTTNLEQLKGHLLVHKDLDLLKCVFCNFKSFKKQVMINHILGHYVIKPYRCFRCPYLISDSSLFKNHLEDHYNETFSCIVCNYVTTTKIKLRKHIVTYHKDSQCPYCPYRAIQTVLRKHILLHPERVKSNSAILKAEREDSGKRVMATEIRRDEVFLGDKERIDQLMINYNELKSRVTFSNNEKKDNLTLNYDKIKIVKDKLTKSLPQMGKKFKCSLCIYNTNDLSEFKLHYSNHPGQKLFKCHFCNNFESNFKDVVDKHVLKGHSDLFEEKKKA